MAGKALDFKVITKINTKIISMTIVEVQLLYQIVMDKDMLVEGVSGTQKEQICLYFSEMRDNIESYSRNGRKKIITILRDV